MNKNNLALYLFKLLDITEFYFNDDNESYYFIYLDKSDYIKYNKQKNTLIYKFDDGDVEYNESNIEELAEIIEIIHFGFNDIGSYEN